MSKEFSNQNKKEMETARRASRETIPISNLDRASHWYRSSDLQAKESETNREPSNRRSTFATKGGVLDKGNRYNIGNDNIFQNSATPDRRFLDRSTQDIATSEIGIIAKNRSTTTQGNKIIKTTTYDYNTKSNKTYLQAAKANDFPNTIEDNQKWTLVTHRKQSKGANQFIFVGNIPTKATNIDI